MDRDAPHVLDIAASARPVRSCVEGVTREDLSPVPASEETHSGFVGMMRGTVVKYEDPFEPATSSSDWSALR